MDNNEMGPVDEIELVGNAPDLSDPAVQAAIRADYTRLMSGEHGGNGAVHTLEDLAEQYKTSVEEIERLVEVA